MRPYQLKIAFVLGLICLFFVNLNAVQIVYEKNPVALIKRFNNSDMTLKIIYDLAVEKKTIGSDSLMLGDKVDKVINLWDEPDKEPMVEWRGSHYEYIFEHHVQITTASDCIIYIIDDNIKNFHVTIEDVIRNWGADYKSFEVTSNAEDFEIINYEVASKDNKRVALQLFFLHGELKVYVLSI